MTEAPPAAVNLERVTVRYGAQPVLRACSLAVAPGELLALLGPSGCGKTTVLKVIAGLLAPVSGDVRFNAHSVANVPAERRGAVLVFQKPLLFPYLTVAENVAFGLRMQRLSADVIHARVTALLDLLQLGDYAARRPHELSGGQEQRVALARALVTEPRVLLLDEPFSALDESLRAELRLLVRALHTRLGMTTIFVTHDQLEAATVADRIALLLDGAVEQTGAPRDFYTAPATLAAARFFGWQVVARGAQWLAFRPECARVHLLDDATPRAETWHGKLVAVYDLGPRLRCRVELPDGSCVEVEQANDEQAARLRPGVAVFIEPQPETVRSFAQP